MPDELTEADLGYIVKNKVYNRGPNNRYHFHSPHSIQVLHVVRLCFPFKRNFSPAHHNLQTTEYAGDNSAQW